MRRIGFLAIVGLSVGVAAGCQQDDPNSLRAIIGDSIAPAGPVDPCVKTDDNDRLIADLLDRVNHERQKRNLQPVKRNDTLDRIAEFYACRLIDGGFFSHVDPDDDSRIDSRAGDFGYAFRKIGENLGAGQYSVEQVMREWMRSPGHRANILDPDFTEIGLAVRLGGEHRVYWVQEFGRPLTAAPIDEQADDVAPNSDAPSGIGQMKDVSQPSATSQPSAKEKSSLNDSGASSDSANDETDPIYGGTSAEADPLFAEDWQTVLELMDLI